MSPTSASHFSTSSLSSLRVSLGHLEQLGQVGDRGVGLVPPVDEPLGGLPLLLGGAGLVLIVPEVGRLHHLVELGHPGRLGVDVERALERGDALAEVIERALEVGDEVLDRIGHGCFLV
jgi:hypothetical protein